MSATIPNGMLLSDLLKATGYDCPDDLQGKTFSQATSGGEADLEANHASTVDVGEYTQPIEITPAEGKDGMEKVTLTLTNIPSGGDATAYAWVSGNIVRYLPVSVAPTDASEFVEKCTVGGGTNSSGAFTIAPFASLYTDYTKVSDTEFTASLLGSPQAFTRNSSKDFTLWQA